MIGYLTIQVGDDHPAIILKAALIETCFKIIKAQPTVLGIIKELLERAFCQDFVKKHCDSIEAYHIRWTFLYFR